MSPLLKAILPETLKLLDCSGTSLSSHPGRLDGTTCMLTRKTDRSTVSTWSPEPTKLHSAFSRVVRRSLSTAPPSRALSQDILRCWERAAREQSIMCNLAAGLSRCLTRVQDAISTQLKNLHLDKGKGKSSERMQQAVDELDYLAMFNRSISQAIARTMQDLTEGVFISLVIFTLAHRDSYLEYLNAGVKQDTFSGLLINRTGSRLSQLGSKYANASRERKVVANLQLSHRNRPRVPNLINDNYCVKCFTGLKDSVCVPGQRGLNPSPVIA